MITLFLLIFLWLFYIYVSKEAMPFESSERSAKVSNILNIILLIAPVIAATVFALLFIFVFEGRFYQRLSHAILVFALWLVAARFYWFVITFFKHKKILVMSLIGMIASVIMAIVLIPLDRYVDMLHSFTRAASVSVGDTFIITFYVIAFIYAGRRKAK